MNKLLVAGVLGVMLMVTAGTQVASAAGWRGGAYRGHAAYSHPVYRTAYARPHAYGYGYGAGYGRYAGPSYNYNNYNRCW